MSELIGRLIILDDESPHNGATVRIVAIEGEYAIAEPVDPTEGFARARIPLADLEDDSVLDDDTLL